MGVSIVLRCWTWERVDFCMEYGRQFSGHGMLTLGCLDMVASSVKTDSKGVIIEMDNWLGFWGDSKVKRLVVWGNKCTWIIDASVAFNHNNDRNTWQGCQQPGILLMAATKGSEQYCLMSWASESLWCSRLDVKHVKAGKRANEMEEDEAYSPFRPNALCYEKLSVVETT